MKRFMLLAVLCLAALSCTQEAELTIAPDVGSFQLGAEGGQFDAIILTNGLWTATCEDGSVSFSPESGDYSLPIHVNVGPNEEHYTKVIRIALTAKVDKLTRTNRIVVTQQSGRKATSSVSKSIPTTAGMPCVLTGRMPACSSRRREDPTVRISRC